MHAAMHYTYAGYLGSSQDAGNLAGRAPALIFVIGGGGGGGGGARIAWTWTHVPCNSFPPPLPMHTPPCTLHMSYYKNEPKYISCTLHAKL